VAVEEGQAGLVGGEVYGGAALVGGDYRILDTLTNASGEHTPPLPIHLACRLDRSPIRVD
jgi:hypothetical protein